MPTFREKISSVKTVVTHANCPDGLASAILIHNALPYAEIKFLRHGTEAYAQLPATPGMLFCDITPPAGRVQEFVDAGAIVLDHHKSARAVVEAFGDMGVFADEDAEKGVSGAPLAFRHVWLPWWVPTRVDLQERALNANMWDPALEARLDSKGKMAARFARLAGVRDTFVRDDPEWRAACAQAEVLTFFPAEDWLATVDPFSWPHWKIGGWWYERLQLGEMLLKKGEKKTEDAIRDGIRGTTKGGHTYLIVQNITPTSNVSDVTSGQIDIVIGYRYYSDAGVGKFQLSLRSQGVVDVGNLSKHYGGGGHTNAAGFTLDWREGFPNPITHIVELLEGQGI